MLRDDLICNCSKKLLSNQMDLQNGLALNMGCFPRPLEKITSQIPQKIGFTLPGFTNQSSLGQL